MYKKFYFLVMLFLVCGSIFSQTPIKAVRIHTIPGDTMYVYPGQYWENSMWYEDSTYEQSIVSVDSHLRWDGGHLEYRIPCVWQSAGLQSSTISPFFSDFKWYSSSTTGIQFVSGYFVCGISHEMYINCILTINRNTSFVVYSPPMPVPVSQDFYDNLFVKQIDGIRGDINGDNQFDYADIELYMRGYKYYIDEELYGGPGRVDFGRSLGIFPRAGTQTDAWVAIASYYNPNDEFLKKFKFGLPMSEPRPGIEPAEYTKSISGNNLTITANAYAVMVSGKLSDGSPWQFDTKIIDGVANIILPEGLGEYTIDAIGVDTPTDVAENEIPVDFSLSQNYPNPFNPTTTISFSIPKSEYVTLKIYDVLGKEIATLINEELSAGTYQKQWDASGVSSGVYFYTMQAGPFLTNKKMNLIK